MNNKYFDEFNLSDSDIEQLKFPILIWSDLNDENKIVLLTQNGEERVVCSQDSYSIQGLIQKLSYDFEEFLKDSSLGDESLHIFKLVEFENGKISWDNLINEYNAKISCLPHKEEEFDKAIIDELNNNYIQDVKTSLIECVYNSIIDNMHTLASELIVETIGFVGEFSYQERFRQITHKTLNADFDVILSN